MHYDIHGSNKSCKGAVTDRNTPLLHVTHVLSGKNKKKAKKIHKYLLSSESKSKNRCAKKIQATKKPKTNLQTHLSQNSHKYIYILGRNHFQCNHQQIKIRVSQRDAATAHVWSCLPFTSQQRWRLAGWGLLGHVGPGRSCLHLLSPASA